MKIIQGHDYYDGAGMGVDTSILFVRDEKVIKEHPFKIYPYYNYKKNKTTEFDYRIILFAGKLYPLVKISVLGNLLHHEHCYYCYDSDSVTNFLKANKFQVSKYYLEKIHKHFEYKENNQFVSWMIENKIATGVVTYGENIPYKHDPSRYEKSPLFDTSNSSFIVSNTSHLSYYEFFRIKPPQEAHMELSNWIGGVLTNRENMVELKDSDKIKKAGFDKKSFRKESTKRK